MSRPDRADTLDAVITRLRLNVIGLGMVGLPTALLFAEAGCDVLGIDIDETKLASLRSGRPTIAEPGLDGLLQAAVRAGRIRFAARSEPADAHIVAVGTPLRGEAPDLAGVRGALQEVRAHLRAGDLLVLESTVPPGTTVALPRDMGIPEGVLVAHAPERVAPSDALREIRENPRVVGGVTPEAGEAAARLYTRISRAPITIVDATTAEFAKLIENTYRDVNIALANELSLMASDLGIDVWEARRIANAHPRVHIHQPGPGVGGHCIGVAPQFLRSVLPHRGELLLVARARNRSMPQIVVQQVERMCGGLDGRSVALFGLAYKPDVADDRDSPTYEVDALLRTAGAVTRIHDPLLRPDLTIEEAVRDADCMVLLVAHSAYRELAPSRAGSLLRARRVIDTVHALDRALWVAAGFTYAGHGEQVGPRIATPA